MPGEYLYFAGPPQHGAPMGGQAPIAGPPGQPPMAGPPGQPPMAGLPGQPHMAGPPCQPPMAGPPGQPGLHGVPPTNLQGYPGQAMGVQAGMGRPIGTQPPMAGPPMTGPPVATAPPSSQPGFAALPSQHGRPMGNEPPMAGPPGQAGPPQAGPPMGSQAPMAGPPMGQHQFAGAAPMGPPGQPGAVGSPVGPPGAAAAPQQRISPESTPHPLTVWQADVELYKGETFYSNGQAGIVPPLPNTPCQIVDQGNASPRFVRSTLYNVPCTQEILHSSNIPLGLVIQPFAEVPRKENTMYVVNTGEAGPIRCRRCKGYINPHSRFVEGGRKFVCNLCNFLNEVPDYYQCQLDQHGQRLDTPERPELYLGSVEFLATTDYCKDSKWPDPPAFIFLVDVSYQSVSCGLLPLLSRMLRLVLEELPKDVGEEKSKVRIGLATFDSSVQFYNLKSNLAQPQMMVMPDIADVFLPFLDGFLVDVEESSPLIEAVLQELPNLYGQTRDTTSCLGPAIQAGVDALKAAGCPGKLFVFSASMPKAEIPGGLKNREDRQLFRTDKEKNLYASQSQFYPQLASECVKHGASIELFCCSTAGYIDIPTMSSLVAPTGGEIHYYPYFNYQADGERLLKDLAHSVSRPTGFDAVMRIRCSTGLRATDFWGNMFMTNTTDVLMPSVDCDKSIAVEVKYDDKVGEEGSQAYYQIALLYTSVGGQRRLRVHNVRLNCTKQLAEVYRCADTDSIMNIFLKKAVRKLHDTPYKSIRGHLLEQSIALLACYRKECSEPASGARLILPEALKLLPLYVCSLIKCEAVCAQSDTRIDDKAWLMHQAACMSVRGSMGYLYPNILPLHNANPDGTGLPAASRCYYECLSQEGVYIIENGLVAFIWIGRHVHPSWLNDVFAVHSLSEIDPEKFVKLPAVDAPMSARVRSILSQVQSRRTHHMKISVVLQGSPREVLARRLLCEDGGGESNPSYMDLLCHVHKEIRNHLS